MIIPMGRAKLIEREESNIQTRSEIILQTVHTRTRVLIYDFFLPTMGKLPTSFAVVNLHRLNETFAALNYELKFSFSRKVVPDFHALREI